MDTLPSHQAPNHPAPTGPPLPLRPHRLCCGRRLCCSTNIETAHTENIYEPLPAAAPVASGYTEPNVNLNQEENSTTIDLGHVNPNYTDFRNSSSVSDNLIILSYLLIIPAYFHSCSLSLTHSQFRFNHSLKSSSYLPLKNLSFFFITTWVFFYEILSVHPSICTSFYLHTFL